MKALFASRLFWMCAGVFCISVTAGVLLYNWAFAVGRALPFGPDDAPRVEFIVPQVQATARATDDPFRATVVAADFTPLTQWNGRERLNVLLLGIDQRDGEQELGYRTDTMILMTLDPVTRQAGMLSIPRDLWVRIPGYGNAKINTANDTGDRYKYPGLGPGLAKKTVEELLGIRIHHHVRLNFTAFEDMIDRLGGIDVDVPVDIFDPKYPTGNFGVEVFKLAKGQQKLDGATALKYARTRHGVTDFERSKRQQQVMLAVQEKLREPRVALSLFANAPEVMENLSGSLNTDLTQGQIQQLVTLALQVDRKSIKLAVFDENDIEYRDTAEGLNVVVANRAAIGRLRAQLFGVQ